VSARIAPLAETDFAALQVLNEAAVPAVNSLPEAALRGIAGMAEAVSVAHAPGGPCGFLVLLAPGADYASPNYRWFARRYADFLYVDRVVVAAGARRRGVGQALYAEAWHRACRRGAPLACEVNLDPPNPGSVAFHRGLGFRQVGVQRTEGGGKTVSLMVRRP